MDPDKEHSYTIGHMESSDQNGLHLSGEKSDSEPIAIMTGRGAARFYDIAQHQPELLHLITTWKSVRGLQTEQSSNPAMTQGQVPERRSQLERYQIAKTEADYARAGDHYRSLEQSERADLVSNLVKDLKHCSEDIQMRMVWHFWHCDAEYGRRVAEAAGIDLARAKRLPPLLGKAAGSHVIKR